MAQDLATNQGTSSPHAGRDTWGVSLVDTKPSGGVTHLATGRPTPTNLQALGQRGYVYIYIYRALDL